MDSTAGREGARGEGERKRGREGRGGRGEKGDRVLTNFSKPLTCGGPHEKVVYLGVRT